MTIKHKVEDGDYVLPEYKIHMIDLTQVNCIDSRNRSGIHTMLLRICHALDIDFKNFHVELKKKKWPKLYKLVTPKLSPTH